MKIFFPTLLSLAIISGCSAGADVSCDSQLAANLMADHVKAEAKQILVNLGRPSVGGPKFNEGTINEILNSFEPSLTSVRSTGNSSDNHKKFCSGNLTFKFPEANKELADKGVNQDNILLLGLLTSGTKDFGAYATKAGMSYSPGHIGDAVDYSVQPTDDGKELYVEFGKVDRLTGWISQFSSSVLMGQRAAISSAFESPASSKAQDAESCTDAKGKKFHEEYGEDALVTADAIDEWTRQCKAGD